jgi:hypothetical protein
MVDSDTPGSTINPLWHTMFTVVAVSPQMWRRFRPGANRRTTRALEHRGGRHPDRQRDRRRREAASWWSWCTTPTFPVSIGKREGEDTEYFYRCSSGTLTQWEFDIVL